MPWKRPIIDREYLFLVKDFKYPDLVIQEIKIIAHSTWDAYRKIRYRYNLPKNCYWEFKNKKLDSKFQIIKQKIPTNNK